MKKTQTNRLGVTAKTINKIKWKTKKIRYALNALCECLFIVCAMVALINALT